tara:strand:- start:222 stop:395 length:174 start_codon:yes stop_codon:yes gene_type:complete
MYEKRAKAAKVMLKKGKTKDNFVPHLMYDKEGNAYKANTHAEHMRMKKMGYKHKEEM